MTDTELQKLVEQISSQFFAKPFRHRARFNSRLRTTGGRYLLRSHDIELNPKHLEEHGEAELVAIIKHELCHYHLHLEKKAIATQTRTFAGCLPKSAEAGIASRSARDARFCLIAMSSSAGRAG